MHEQARPDPALGVFETMLASGGRIQALERHLDRLAIATSELYRAPLPDDLAQRVRAAAHELIGPHRLRIDAVPRRTTLAYEITVTPVAGAAAHESAVSLRPVVVAGGIGPHKWRDRRLIDALHSGGTVPLILDAPDELLEAGSMNVWVSQGRALITPPADGRILPGVTRALLLELAPALGLRATTGRITLESARAADAIFVTSSIRRISAAVLADGTGPEPQRALLAAAKAALDAAEWV